MITDYVSYDPYYAIIEHHGKDRVLDMARIILAEQKYEFVRGDHLRHCRLYHHDCVELLKLSPIARLYPHSGVSKPYASIFSTSPGCYYRAHKDGLSIRYALNYILEVDDEECVTSWYSDTVDVGYQHDQLDGASRELVDFEKHKHTPLATVVFKKNQCILFNTDIYHDFDNRTSKNWRHILTLRWGEPPDFYWENAIEAIKTWPQNTLIK